MKNVKKLIAILITTLLFVSVIAIPQSAFAADYKTMRDISAKDLVAEMKIGLSVGNSLDAAIPNGSNETYWGNPKITKQLILAYKNAGFKTIRFPVTWVGNMESDGTPKAAWLARVKEVTNWILEEGLYCILNTHHEQSWLNTKTDGMATRKAKFKKLWTCLANEFADYGDHLLFEGYNEILKADGDWSAPSATDVKNANELAQDFVTAVRATGGKNAKRILIASTYGATHKPDGFVLPTDTATNKLAVEFHCYFPQSFCFRENSQSTWGSYNDLNTVESFCEVFADSINNPNVPMILGEFGAVDKNNTAARVAYTKKVVSTCKQYNILPIWWDNGNYTKSSADKFGLFDRSTYKNVYPDIVNALVDGTTSSTPTTVTTKPATQTTTTTNGNSSTGTRNVLYTTNIWKNIINWSKTEGWHGGANNLSDFSGALSANDEGLRINTTGMTFNSQQAQIVLFLNKIQFKKAIETAKANNTKLEFDVKVNSVKAGSSPQFLKFSIRVFDEGKPTVTIAKELEIQDEKHFEVDPNLFDTSNLQGQIVVLLHAGEWNTGFTFCDVLLTPMVVYDKPAPSTSATTTTTTTTKPAAQTTTTTKPAAQTTTTTQAPSGEYVSTGTYIGYDKWDGGDPGPETHQRIKDDSARTLTASYTGINNNVLQLYTWAATGGTVNSAKDLGIQFDFTVNSITQTNAKLQVKFVATDYNGNWPVAVKDITAKVGQKATYRIPFSEIKASNGFTASAANVSALSHCQIRLMSDVNLTNVSFTVSDVKFYAANTATTKPTTTTTTTTTTTKKPTTTTTTTKKPTTTTKPATQPTQPTTQATQPTIQPTVTTQPSTVKPVPTTTKKPVVTAPTTKPVVKVSLKTPKVKFVAGKKKIKIKYKKVKNATGFQVRYRIKGKWKIKSFNTKKSVTRTLKNLKKGKYKIQIRSYVKVRKYYGDWTYSKWTKVKTVKVK